MWAYSDMNAREIAAAMDLSENAVHQLLYRARAALRAALDGGKREKGRTHAT